MKGVVLFIFVQLTVINADLPSCERAKCHHCRVAFISKMCPQTCEPCPADKRVVLDRELRARKDSYKAAATKESSGTFKGKDGDITRPPVAEQRPLQTALIRHPQVTSFHEASTDELSGQQKVHSYESGKQQARTFGQQNYAVNAAAHGVPSAALYPQRQQASTAPPPYAPFPTPSFATFPAPTLAPFTFPTFPPLSFTPMTLAPPPQLFQPSLLGMPQLPSAQLSTVAPPVQQQPFIGLPTVPPEPPPNPIPPPPPATANIPFQHSYPPPYVLQRAVITYPVYRPDQPSQQLQTYQHSYYPPQTAYYSTNQQTVIPQQPIPQPQAAQVIQAPASRAPAPSYSIDSANTFVDKNFSTGKGVPSPIAQCPRQPNWEPCISKDLANQRFRACCQNLGDGCVSLCSYDSTLTTIQLAVLTGRCPISKVGDMMICASGNEDATPCCEAYNVFEPGFEHCRPYCNPSAGLPQGGLLSEQYKCLGKLSQIQRCFYVTQRP